MPAAVATPVLSGRPRQLADRKRFYNRGRSRAAQVCGVELHALIRKPLPTPTVPIADAGGGPASGVILGSWLGSVRAGARHRSGTRPGRVSISRRCRNFAGRGGVRDRVSSRHRCDSRPGRLSRGHRRTRSSNYGSQISLPACAERSSDLRQSGPTARGRGPRGSVCGAPN